MWKVRGTMQPQIARCWVMTSLGTPRFVRTSRWQGLWGLWGERIHRDMGLTGSVGTLGYVCLQGHQGYEVWGH